MPRETKKRVGKVESSKSIHNKRNKKVDDADSGHSNNGGKVNKTPDGKKTTKRKAESVNNLGESSSKETNNNDKKIRGKTRGVTAKFVEDEETVTMEVDTIEDARFDDNESSTITFKAATNNNATMETEESFDPMEVQETYQEDETDGEFTSDNESNDSSSSDDEDNYNVTPKLRSLSKSEAKEEFVKEMLNEKEKTKAVCRCCGSQISRSFSQEWVHGDGQ